MVAQLAPSGEVVTERAAQLILAQWEASNQTAADVAIIAGAFAKSVSTVERAVVADTLVRVPCAGQGRMTFAGFSRDHAGGENRKLLEQAEAAGPCDDLTRDILNCYMDLGSGGDPTESCVAATLRGPDFLFTRKVLAKRARSLPCRHSGAGACRRLAVATMCLAPACERHDACFDGRAGARAARERSLERRAREKRVLPIGPRRGRARHRAASHGMWPCALFRTCEAGRCGTLAVPLARIRSRAGGRAVCVCRYGIAIRGRVDAVAYRHFGPPRPAL